MIQNTHRAKVSYYNCFKSVYVYGIPTLQPPRPFCILAGIAAENPNSTKLNLCVARVQKRDR